MKNSSENNENYEDKIFGRESVLEILKSEKDINKIYIQEGEKHGSILKIEKIAKERKIPLIYVPKNKLDKMSESKNHQGVVVEIPPFDYSSVDDILDYAEEKNEYPFILILDGIEDPRNFGSIIRTAECTNVHGIIIPKRNSASVNSTVFKTSAGALNFVKIARVTNLNQTIKYLQENDVWIYGTDVVKAEDYRKQNYANSGVGIVIGSEGFGVSKQVKENCDFLIKIPMYGKINSLNASVSAGILMYEVINQRKGK